MATVQQSSTPPRMIRLCLHLISTLFSTDKTFTNTFQVNLKVKFLSSTGEDRLTVIHFVCVFYRHCILVFVNNMIWKALRFYSFSVKHCTKTAKPLHKRCTNIAQTPQHRCTNVVQTLHKHCTNIVQTMHKLFAKQCTNFTQTLYKHSTKTPTNPNTILF